MLERRRGGTAPTKFSNVSLFTGKRRRLKRSHFQLQFISLFLSSVISYLSFDNSRFVIDTRCLFNTFLLSNSVTSAVTAYNVSV